MILYKESTLEEAYNIYRKECMKIGIQTCDLETFRVIYEKIIESHLNDPLRTIISVFEPDNEF